MPDRIAETAREVMSDENPLTDARRERFEDMGEETVATAMGTDPYRLIGSGRVQAAARAWLKEKRDAREHQQAEDRKLNRLSQKTGIAANLIQSFVSVGTLIGLVLGSAITAFVAWLLGGF